MKFVYFLLCISDIDECLSYPCRHGGTCVDLVNRYECKCVNGFSGNNCGTGNQLT
jgi:hypothetical protein